MTAKPASIMSETLWALAPLEAENYALSGEESHATRDQKWMELGRQEAVHETAVPKPWLGLKRGARAVSLLALTAAAVTGGYRALARLSPGQSLPGGIFAPSARREVFHREDGAGRREQRFLSALGRARGEQRRRDDAGGIGMATGSHESACPPLREKPVLYLNPDGMPGSWVCDAARKEGVVEGDTGGRNCRILGGEVEGAQGRLDESLLSAVGASCAERADDVKRQGLEFFEISRPICGPEEACPEEFVMMTSVVEPMSRIANHALDMDDGNGTALRAWLQRTGGQCTLGADAAMAAAKGECESPAPYGVPASYASYDTDWGGAHFDNLFIRMLLGWDVYALPVGGLNEVHLEAAWEILQRFEIVIRAENEEDYAQVSARLGWKPDSLAGPPVRHPLESRQQFWDRDPGLRELVREHNRLDVELFERASKLAEDITRGGPRCTPEHETPSGSSVSVTIVVEPMPTPSPVRVAPGPPTDAPVSLGTDFEAFLKWGARERGDPLRCEDTSYAGGFWRQAEDPVDGINGLRTRYIAPGGAADVERAFEQDFPGQVRPPASYEWVPSDCELLPFSREGLCEALDGRSFLMVGDSTTYEMFFVMVMQMHGDTTGLAKSQFNPGPSGPVEICPPAEGRSGPGSMIGFIRNDHLTTQNPPREPPATKQEGHAACSPEGDICYPWLPFLEDYDVLLLNMGAHTVGKPARFEELTRNTLRGLKENGYQGDVIYRTAVPGHTHCANATGPVTTSSRDDGSSPGSDEEDDGGHPARDDAFALFEDYQNPQYKRFRWGDILTYNEIAKDLWSEAGAMVLDGQPILRSRPDGHRSEGDCLHYCLPGPPDTWAILIYNALVGRIV